MKRVHKILKFLHMFVGIGAMFGGIAAMLNPSDPLGITPDVLENSPFHNFLIPGIILFVIIGLGNVIAGLLFRFQLKYQGYISSVFSWALVFFLVIQCIMIQSIAALHIIYFVIGLVEALLSFILLADKNLFPANLVMMFAGKLKIVKKQ